MLISNVSTGLILIIMSIYVKIINKIYYGNNYFTFYIKKYIYIIRDKMIIIGLIFILIGLLLGIIFLNKKK